MPPSSVLVNILTVAIKASVVFLLLLLARGLVWLTNLLLVLPLFDPLKSLPGPDGGALQNHFRDVMDPTISPDTHQEWVKAYGRTFRFHGFGKHDYRLMSFDFRVIQHVLNSPTYEKPWQTRSLLARLIGRGIFSMEGAEHKFQRKIIGPAFSTQALKKITPIFFQKAEELCGRWESLVTPAPLDETKKAEGTVFDIAHWISRATFDVIGLAGFGYHFHALHDESEDVYLSYRRMFNVADKGPGLKGLLQLYFPFLEYILPDEGSRITRQSLRVIDRAGRELVANKKATILSDKANTHDIEEKDILSLLIKSNLSNDPSKRLSDAELVDQCSTFLLAGSDSVSVGISYALHLLSQHPHIQTRLRDEILSLPITSATLAVPREASGQLTSPPLDSGFAGIFSPPPPQGHYSASPLGSDYCPQAHWEALETLPLLDAVVRETLRICPPVHGTIRMATVDDRIPISHPVLLRDGTVVHKGEYIHIRKGSYVHIPIEGLNYSEEIWGKDAREFNPERWTSLPPNARSPQQPGLGNTMTFSFGPHSCLGYKFSIAEMKVFIATILPHFVFNPAEGIEISKFNAILTRPYVVDKWELGTQLPVAVSRFSG